MFEVEGEALLVDKVRDIRVLGCVEVVLTERTVS
jgi:hypothetical protein